jgi:hypothetical protein
MLDMDLLDIEFQGKQIVEDLKLRAILGDRYSPQQLSDTTRIVRSSPRRGGDDFICTVET